MKYMSFFSWTVLAASMVFTTSCDLLENKDEESDEPQLPMAELYAFYAFEGNTSSSGQSKSTGVLTKGTYVEGVDGKKALELPPDGYLSIPEGMIDKVNSTIAFWAKDLYDGHIFHAEKGNQSSAFVLGVVDGGLRFVRTEYNSNYQFYNHQSFSNSTLDGWHHIALVTTADTKKLYLDGQLCDQLEERIGADYNNGIRFILGGKLGSPYLNGSFLTLDNLRIYHEALSDSEVKKVYDSEKPKGFKPGKDANTSNVVNNALYAYFNFDGSVTDATRTGIQPTVTGTTFTDSYNGSKALKIPASGSLFVPEGMIDQKYNSICFWAKDLYDGHIMHAEKNGQTSIFVLGVVDGRLRFARTEYNCQYLFNMTQSFVNGTLNGWHHIAIVASNSRKMLYIDGILCDQLTENINNEFNNGIRFTLGGSLETPYLNAATLILDNLRIYKYRAITADDVKQIYEFEK